MQSQTAQESGAIGGSIFTKLSSLNHGDKVELFSMPEFTTHVEYGEQASIESSLGTLQTNNRNTIGQLKSDNENSLGQILARHLDDGKGLTVFVQEVATLTEGRTQKVLSTINKKKEV